MPQIPSPLAAALAAHRRGDLATAEMNYRAVLPEQPDSVAALHGLGVLAAQRGDFTGSIALLERAVALDPDASDALSNLGHLLLRQGDTARAVPLLERAVALDPNNPAAHNNLGLAHGMAGALAPAEAAFTRAIALAPRYAEAQANLALVLRRSGRTKEALAPAERAVALAPGLPEAQQALAATLTALGRHDAALPAYRAAAKLSPGSVPAEIALGGALARADRLADAVARAERLVAEHDAAPAPLTHYGDLLMRGGRVAAAEAAYRLALEIEPDYAPAELGLGMVLGQQGRLDQAFAHLERRLEMGGDRLRPDAARWRGERFSGRTLLIHAEQGVGDTLQFLRYVPLAAARGGTIVLAVHRSLTRLASHLAPIVVPLDAKLPPADLEIPLMSLAALFGTRVETIPPPVTLSPTPPDLRLAGQSRPQIGLAWAGHPGHLHDHARSLSAMHIAPLLEIPNVTMVVLQTERRAPALTSRPGVLDLGGALGDFAETAGVIAGLDLVISVDSAVAHLAGCLGVPVWTMLPYAADWRWLSKRDDTPWYPAMTLFRQDSPGDWDGVVARVADSIRRRYAA